MNKPDKSAGELVEVLAAISLLTARMAKSLVGITLQGSKQKGEENNGRNRKNKCRNQCSYCRP